VDNFPSIISSKIAVQYSFSLIFMKEYLTAGLRQACHCGAEAGLPPD
jgi:hypothetical protein